VDEYIYMTSSARRRRLHEVERSPAEVPGDGQRDL
jgi:hypothetical protein